MMLNFLTVCFVVATLFINGIYGFSVSGNKILDPNGNPILLRGVDRCSFEWNPVGEEASLSDYQLMKDWGANVVRITSNQDFWLNGSATYAVGYKATIDQQVQWITSLGMAVIIDLHWSDQGNLQASGAGQQCMADSNSLTYWTEVATIYKNDPLVIFELYNEPHDVAWDVWLNGGSGCSFNVAGMQQLYAAVRATGANNLVIAGGLNYAFDLSGVATNAIVGTNIAYSTHPYDESGKDSTTWDAAFGYLTATYPVIATEFGQYCLTDPYVQTLLAYMEQKGMHWTAWAWYVNGCSFPSIISDWKGTPASGAGQLVLAALGGNFTGTTGSLTTGGVSSSSTGGSTPPATSNFVVYTDSLQPSWESYGWATDLVFNATAYVHTGSDAISFTPSDYAACYLHTTSPFDPNAYEFLQFYIDGGQSSGQTVKVIVYDTSASPVTTGNEVNLPSAVQATTWVLQSIPTSAFGVPSGTQISGFAIEATVGGTQPIIYIDDISFIAPVGTTGGATVGATGGATAGATEGATAGATGVATTGATGGSTARPTSGLTTSTTSPAFIAAASSTQHSPVVMLFFVVLLFIASLM